MDLIMTEYQPRAQCEGPGSFPLNATKLAICVELLELMEISERPIVFGPGDDPATQATTPYLIIARGAPYLFLLYEFAYGFTL